MKSEESLAVATAEWQRKHGIADDDPIVAMLDLVRIHLRHARDIDDDPESQPPPFAEFRSTIELLDRRSKSFIQQAADIMGELRHFGQSVERLNQDRFATRIALTTFGVIAGFLLARFV